MRTCRRASISALVTFVVFLLIGPTGCGGGGGGGAPSTTMPPPSSAKGAPIATILAPGTASGYATITLDGSGSYDATSTISNYAWTQTAGPAVKLGDANSATTTFIAPNLLQKTMLSFALRVTDALDATASSTASIVIAPANPTAVPAVYVTHTFMRPVSGNPHTNAVSTDTPPLAGAQSILRVSLGGAISQVGFSLIDQGNNSLGAAALSLAGDSSLQPLDYIGTITTPTVPFYIVAIGKTGDGKSFTLKSPSPITPINMTLAFSSDQSRIARGASYTTNLVITNNGGSATFDVSFSDPHQLLNQPLDSTVAIGAGHSASLPVTVTLPSTLSGVVAARVRATASVSGDAARAATTTFTAWLEGAP
jgi:hypothetical protein